MGTGIVVIVHSPHPVGEPGRADFQKSEFDPAISLHNSAADERHATDHQIERHSYHMDVKIRVLKSFLPGTVETAGDPVNADGGSEFVRLTKKRLEIPVVQISLT